MPKRAHGGGNRCCADNRRQLLAEAFAIMVLNHRSLPLKNRRWNHSAEVILPRPSGIEQVTSPIRRVAGAALAFAQA
jgi:hypothetical protein